MKEFDEGIRQFNEEMERLKKKDEQEYQLEIKALAQRAAELAEEKRQFDAQMAFEREQLEASKPKYTTYVTTGKTSNGSQTVTYSNKSGSTTYVNDGGTGNQKKSSTTGSKSGNYPIDYASLTALGYSGISAAKLNDLVSKGILIETVKNGKLTYSAPRTYTPAATRYTMTRT